MPKENKNYDEKENINHIYQSLIDFHTEELNKEGANDQKIKNRITALKKFMETQRKSPDDFIGDELMSNINYAIDKHLNESSITDKKGRKYHINLWHKSYTRLILKSKLPNKFGKAFKALKKISKMTLKNISKKTGIPESAMEGWLYNNKIPGIKTKSKIPLLEKTLGSPTGTLEVLIPKKRVSLKEKIKTNHSKKLAELIKSPYRLNKPTKQLLEEWKDLVDFMTCEITPPGYQRNSTWRLRHESTYKKNHHHWNKKKNDVCVTASIAWQFCSSFFGWLMLPIEKGGKQYEKNNLTLALLSDANLVWEYIQWRRNRSECYTSETVLFINRCMSLTRENTGWLAQNSRVFSKRLGLKEDKWLDHCKNNRNQLDSILKDLKSNNSIKKGREPKDPIINILSMSRPMEALHVFCDRMKKERPLTHHCPVTKALHARDELLINMLSSNPLRINMYATLTFKKNGSGNLRKTMEGVWRLVFKSEDFKNEKGAASDDYDVPVAKDIWPLIETYFKEHHPILLNNVKSDIVFPIMPKSDNKNNWGNCMSDIGTTINTLAFRYISDFTSSGFGPQAFRHIIATDYLKNNPNGFQVVANVLHDKLQTVLDNYAHLKVADGVEHFLNYREETRNKFLNNTESSGELI